jgi:YYY domain-containing protein
MTGVLNNSMGGVIISVSSLIALSAWFFLKGRIQGSADVRSGLLSHLRQHWRLILVTEVLFLLAFIAWAGLRAYAPDKVANAGGEKFMEMAFLNGVLKSPQFPPLDPWLSGYSISYYYFGYIMMGLMTLFSGAPPGVGFDLYDALLFALTAIGAFGVVYNLVAMGIKGFKPEPQKQGQAIRYGLFGTLLVLILGNLEGLLEAIYTKGILSESFWRWIDIPGLLGAPITNTWQPGGWFFSCCWRASRVLQDYDLSGNPVGASPITEFPIFSFLLGDNHPHVLALPFVLLSIALAINLIQHSVSASKTNSAVGQPAAWWNPIQLAFDRDWKLFLFYALCLGSLGFLNTWDMPIYLGLVTLAFAVGDYSQVKRVNWPLVRNALVVFLGLLLTALFLYIFFYVGFSSQASGFLLYSHKPTRLPQFLVIFGTFLIILLWYLLTDLASSNNLQQTSRAKFNWLRSWLLTWVTILIVCISFVLVFLLALAMVASLSTNMSPAIQALVGSLGPVNELSAFVLSRLANPWLFLLLTAILALVLTNLGLRINKFNASSDQIPESTHENLAADLFAYLIILLGFALILSVELVFLRDSFSVRMNTVFKFYYQAWILLGCASAYGTWWVLNRGLSKNQPVLRYAFLGVCSLVIAAGLIYPIVGATSRVDNFRQPPNLDGTSGLSRMFPDDFAGIEWLNENITGLPVILEAPGKSYNYEGRFSAFSGYPTVLGWALHEGQWRGSYTEQGVREFDIQTIYSTKDSQVALDLLRKWNVKYVILGTTEKNYIIQLCSDPQRACDLNHAIRKFDTMLTPVFQQGELTIYLVPGTES